MKIEARNWGGTQVTVARKNSSDKESLAQVDEESLQAKRLRDMKEGLQRLQAMPSAKESAKKLALARVEQLKKQIEQLRALLMAATPEQARALARQIAVIAKELSGLAKETGGNTSSATVATSTKTTNTSSDTSTASQARDAEKTANTTGADTDSVSSTETVKPTKATALLQQNAPQKSEDSDKDLRNSLQDAAKKLKNLIELLKTRLREHDKLAQSDVRKAESSLNQLNETLNRSELYSALGSATGANASINIGSLSGHIDTQA